MLTDITGKFECFGKLFSMHSYFVSDATMKSRHHPHSADSDGQIITLMVVSTLTLKNISPLLSPGGTIYGTLLQPLLIPRSSNCLKVKNDKHKLPQVAN